MVNLLAALVSGLLLVALVVVARLDTSPVGRDQAEQLNLRELEMAPPPPPPPPPPQQKRQQESKPALQLSSTGEGPTLAVAPVAVDTTLEQITPPNPVNHQQALDWDQALAVDWSAFGLGELDASPRLLSTPSITFPAALTRQHIYRVTVRLDVFIDETGRVTLVAIAENPYPELEPVIRRIVSATRFTAPLKDGQPVRARFIWPLEIKE